MNAFHEQFIEMQRQEDAFNASMADEQMEQKRDEEIRRKLASDALHKLACGLGGEKEIQILAAEIGISDEFRN